jgi:hypothetical protein
VIRKYKKNYERKIIKISSGIIISVLALVISIVTLYLNHVKSLPKFSLEILDTDENDKDNPNRAYKITNTGEQISNVTIVPHMYLDMNLVSTINGMDFRCGHYREEFTDYFSENYFFDAKESSVVIQENKANMVFDYMELLNKQLLQNELYIDYYALQLYFEISYNDYRNKQHDEIYGIENNNNYIFYLEDDNNLRYFKDNKLKKIKDIKEADVSESITSAAIEILVEDDIGDIKRQKNKICTYNCYENDAGSSVRIYPDLAEDLLIEKETGLTIGIKVKDSN